MAFGLSAVAALAPLAGCANSHKAAPTAAASASSPTTAPSSSSATVPSATPTAVTSAAANLIVGPADCASLHLALQAGHIQGAVGSLIATYILRNTGALPCTLFGFPGVSLLNSGRQQVGAAASRQGTAFPKFTLQPGQVGSFLVQIAHAGCPATSPHSQTIRIFPPNQRSALTALLDTPVCTAPSATAVRAGIVDN
jgi:hypothetical protein